MTWRIGKICAAQCLSIIEGISSQLDDFLMSSSQSCLNIPSVENDISGIDGYKDSVIRTLVRFSDCHL